MLIKVSVPFVLAATVLGARVPQRRDNPAITNIACPSQAGSPNNGEIPSTGLVGVRDLTHDLVGYLAPPTGDGQLFSFTNDKTKALTAAISPIVKEDGSDEGRYWKIRLGISGTENILGATTISIGDLDGHPGGPGGPTVPSTDSVPNISNLPAPGPGGATNGVNAVPAVVANIAAVVGLDATIGVNNSPSSGSSPGSPSIGNFPSVPGIPNGGNLPAPGGLPSPGSLPSPGGASPPQGGGSSNPPATGGNVPPTTGTLPEPTKGGANPTLPGGVFVPNSGGSPPPQSGSYPSLGNLVPSLSQIALSAISSNDVTGDVSGGLSNVVGGHVPLQFVLDKESNQILTKPLSTDDAYNKVMNWQFNDGKFCMSHGGNNYVQENGSGQYVNLFLVSL